MKKIISFALWGNNKKYYEGALKNAELQEKYYKSWTCRFYVDNTVPEKVTEILKEKGAEVVMMPKSDANYGLYWRFEPLKDLTIERFIVRDTDSRLSMREAAAVKEWEESGLEFHIMRDNYYHKVYICGGMWGATSEFIKKYAPLYDKDLKQYLASIPFNILMAGSRGRGKYFDTDQPFLWKYVWPRIINSHIAHIKDIPELRFTGKERIFQIQNPDGTFIGQPID